jgi:hypothetical protein
LVAGILQRIEEADQVVAERRLLAAAHRFC